MAKLRLPFLAWYSADMKNTDSAANNPPAEVLAKLLPRRSEVSSFPSVSLLRIFILGASTVLFSGDLIKVEMENDSPSSIAADNMLMLVGELSVLRGRALGLDVE